MEDVDAPEADNGDTTPSDLIRPRPRFRRLWLWVTLAAIGGCVVIAIAVFSVLPHSSALLKQKIVEVLSERLDSDVDVADAHLRILPSYRIDLFDLTIRSRRRPGRLPLIRVSKVTASGRWPALLRRHVSDVRLDDLEINIPPAVSTDAALGEQVGGPSAARVTLRSKEIVIDRLVSTGARLSIIPAAKGKSPMVWDILELAMQTVAFDHATPFRAKVMNAIPPGEIATQGILGPWQSEDPGATSLEGVFTFARADLSVFKGISGILSAHGEFGGSLDRIGVHGETDVPQFTVALGGHPVPLHADYHSTIDGTTGNTVLDRVDASFLSTSLVAKGSVIDSPRKDGRTVTLEVGMNKARVEDVLRLVVEGPTSPITGALTLSTKFVIPPGDRDVVDKLRLDGQFSIGTATFTNFDIQGKVNILSQRGRGEASIEPRPGVVSNFAGQFHLANGTLALRSLRFGVPGAGVQLTGTYALRPERLDFRGSLELDAKMSETQRGWKRLLLKALDPIFAKKGGGGTSLPIRIEGPRSDPSFGIDKAALFRRRDTVKKSNTPGRP